MAVPSSCGHECHSRFLCVSPLIAIIGLIQYTNFWIIIMDSSICAYWLVELFVSICLDIRVLLIPLMEALLNSDAKSHIQCHHLYPVITHVYHCWHMNGWMQLKPPWQWLRSQRSIFRGLPSHIWPFRCWVLCNSAPRSRLYWYRAILCNEQNEAWVKSNEWIYMTQSIIAFNTAFGKQRFCVHVVLLLLLNRLRNGFNSDGKIRQMLHCNRAFFCNAGLLSLAMFLNSEFHPC